MEFTFVEYAVLTVPLGNVVVVIASATFTVMLRFAVAEPCGLEESVTFTVKFVEPDAVGVPMIAPVLVLRLRPAGRLPLLILQV